MSSFQVMNVVDSFASFRDLPTAAFDVCITDPPYNAHVQANMCSGSLVGTKAVPKYELPFAPLAGFDWVPELVRITRRWVVSFCAVEDFGEFKRAAQEQYVRGCIWLKPNSMGQLSADRPATAFEGIALMHTKSQKKRWGGRGSYGVWKCNGTRGIKGRHPNQKPIDLCLKLVALFSERGETVFDPFCGSGALGEACVRLGRNYVGLDQSPEWVEKARFRIDAAAQSLPLLSDENALDMCRAFGKDVPPENT
jgi:site-specific DNA-methyltransferase (adenine-specific)